VKSDRVFRRSGRSGTLSRASRPRQARILPTPGDDRYSSGGPEALNDRSPRPDRIWNRIPDAERQRIIELALDEPALSPRELAVCFTDTKGYFVSEASVYRLLKAAGLIASPAFIVIKAANAFKNKTTAATAVADRLHLSQGDRLGVVLPVDRARRLLPLHRRLETMHHNDGSGCDRHARPGAAGLEAC
jgi:Homeodomain-like domain